MLSVTDGHRPFQIIFKPGFQLSALVVRLRKVTVFLSRLSQGILKSRRVFELSDMFFQHLSNKKMLVLGERHGGHVSFTEIEQF